MSERCVKKCGKCNKRISVLETMTCKCRCGNVYCCKHRLLHDCTYNYANDYQKLEKVEEKKLDKI